MQSQSISVRLGVLAIAALYVLCGFQRTPLAFADEGTAVTAANARTSEARTFEGITFEGRDSLLVTGERSEDAQSCLDSLCWEPVNFSVKVQAAEDASLRIVHFPSPRPCGVAQVDQVTCEWYFVTEADDATRVARRPAVVVVHESGSKMVVGRLIAKELRRNGLHAFLVQLPGYGERKSEQFNPDDLTKTFAQGVGDVRRARDAIASIPEVDNENIAIQGTSLGGFVATMAAGLDDRFDSVFLLLCGGDLHGVLTKGAKDAQKTLERLRSSGVRDEDLKELLYQVEPLRIADRIAPEHTWLFSGKFDRVVPPEHSRLLAEKIGLHEKNHVQLLANHYSGIVFLPEIVGHIRDTLTASAEGTGR